MTTVASIHLAGINVSRQKCGIPAMTLAEAERAFADVAHPPVRAKGSTLPTGANQASADTMWGGIVARLNTTVRAKPIGPSSGRIASPAASPGNSSNRTVDWGEISRGLNEQAGLATPARRA
jgi:hypothetical protein